MGRSDEDSLPKKSGFTVLASLTEIVFATSIVLYKLQVLCYITLYCNTSQLTSVASLKYCLRTVTCTACIKLPVRTKNCFFIAGIFLILSFCYLV